MQKKVLQLHVQGEEFNVYDKVKGKVEQKFCDQDIRAHNHSNNETIIIQKNHSHNLLTTSIVLESSDKAFAELKDSSRLLIADKQFYSTFWTDK